MSSKERVGHHLLLRPFYAVAHLGYLFGLSIWRGGSVVLGSRAGLWLLPGYALALYGHRFIENTLLSVYTRRAIGVAAYAELGIGGSYLGGALGSLAVLVLARRVPTPLPWLRLDALLLLLIWYMPYSYPEPNKVAGAWRIAGLLVGISFGWGAGDTSLLAYIQSTLSNDGADKSNIHDIGDKEPSPPAHERHSDVSTVSAVIGFLYVSHVMLFSIVNPQLGRYVDRIYNAGRPVQDALVNIAGVHLTVLAAIIGLATLLPRGALAWNPTLSTLVRRDPNLSARPSPVDAKSDDDAPSVSSASV